MKKHNLSEKHRKKRKIPRKYWVIGSILLLFLILFIIGEILPSPLEKIEAREALEAQQEAQKVDICDTEIGKRRWDCLFDASEKCDDYKVQMNDPDIGVVEYEITSDDSGCTFKKTIIEINEDTPVKDFLEKTSVECRYKKYNFNKNWINSLYWDLEECKGDLREKLAELLLFV